MPWVKKWDYKKRDYVPYQIPDNWHCPMVAADMTEIVNCASCGKEMTFGEGYNSRVIHGTLGFSYTVCESCMNKEWAAENAARKEKQHC